MALALEYIAPPGRVMDLGAGSGSLAKRFMAHGFEAVTADVVSTALEDAAHFRLDLNQPEFHRELPGPFDLVTAVEVIEHLENPIGFLRSVSQLLQPSGVAIITTPNVENVPARLRLLVDGRIRTMDEKSQDHISPIFCDLFLRQYLPRAGMHLVQQRVHPPGGYPLTSRRWMVPFFRILALLLKGSTLTGDSHIFVLKRAKP